MLRSIAPGLYEAEQELRMPGGARLPARMTVIRGDDGVVLLSPIRIDDALAAQIDTLGPVRHLVAPNAYHHLFINAALRRWPQAQLHGPVALQKKRADLAFDTVIGAGSKEVAGGVLRARLVEGAPSFDEVVFFHEPTRSLLVTDLVFNLQEPGNFPLALVMRLMGCHRRLAQSRLWSVIGKDRPAGLRSMKDIWEWPFERLVPAHGAVVDEGARPRLEAGLRWSRLT